MAINVIREQLPVGQGCFATGIIALDGTGGRYVAEAHYVYDCGARNLQLLREAIDNYRFRTNRLNALFVSHFDSDHAAGLDHLLACVTVDTVYIPYLDNIAPILDIVEATEEGTATMSFIQMLLEPESWFGQRGVQRVVRVRREISPGDGPDLPPDPVVPTRGDAKTVTLKESREPKLRRNAIQGKNCRLEEVMLGTSILISSNQGFLDWVLIPYVHPAPQERRDAFIRRLRQSLSLNYRAVLTSEILATALRSPQTRDSIRECYDEIVGGGATRRHNRLSMSLYSGPAHRESNTRWSLMTRHPVSLSRWIPGPADAVGWVGTGDAHLNIRSMRREWLSFYRPVSDNITTILLPHHGSRHNFDRQLLGLQNLQSCVVSADDPAQGYHHPSESVVQAVISEGKFFYHVSRHPQSGFYEHIGGS